MERHVMPPGSWLGLRVRSDDLLRLIDVEGQQVADFVSAALDDPDELLAMYPSRAMARSWRLTKGDTLYSNRSRPLWLIEDDTVGENYCGGGYCNRAINEARYGAGDAPTCGDNLVAAFASLGIDRQQIDFDACFNVFMTVTYDENGAWEIREPKGHAGDHIDLRARADQYVAISNCPQIRNPVNAYKLKPIVVEVTRAR